MPASQIMALSVLSQSKQWMWLEEKKYTCCGVIDGQAAFCRFPERKAAFQRKNSIISPVMDTTRLCHGWRGA